MNIKLNKIDITDFARISKLSLELEPGLTIIGGRNAQGKSSAIDALVWLLYGDKALPKAPVRKGAERADVVGTLATPSGNITVKRYVKATGNTGVELTNEDGFKAGSPQKTLDSWLGAIALDPLAFTRLDGKKQVELLKTVFRIDTSAIDEARKAAYDERTTQNVKVRDIKARAEEFNAQREEIDNAPDDEVSVSELTNRLSEIHAHNDACELAKGDAERAADRLVQADEKIAHHQELIDDLRNRLAQALATMAEYETKRKDIGAHALAQQKIASTMEKLDDSGIREAIASAEGTNRLVRLKAQRAKLRAEYKAAFDQSEALTAKIAQCDADKSRLLESATMPVDGLTFTDEGLFLNDIPFERASSAEQIRVSVPMAFAQNPALKLAIIRDGSLLDNENLALVAQLVDEAGASLIMERVGDGDECTVIIEDGHAVEEVAA